MSYIMNELWKTNTLITLNMVYPYLESYFGHVVSPVWLKDNHVYWFASRGLAVSTSPI